MLWDVRVSVVEIVVGALSTISRDLEKKTWTWMNQDYPGNSIVKIGHNSQKSPGDFTEPSKLAVTLNTVKNTPALTGVKNSHWAECQKRKTTMHNPAPVLENDTHKLLWDFDIQTDHQISTRRPDLIIINNKKRKSAKLSTLLSRLTTE